MSELVSIKLKTQFVVPKLKKDTDERVFWTIATSQVVDTQKEIIDMKYIKSLLPIIKARGMAVNLGHFGFNVGHTKEVYLKTFAEVMKAFPKNKKVQEILSKYDPKTPALVAKGQVYKGNKYDDIAWKMVQNGDINGSSVGLQLTETEETICDSGGCGKVMKADAAMFELALTGKDIDFPIKSHDPSNPTSLILGFKAKDFKESEHPRDGGKFSKKPGSGKKPEKREHGKKLSDKEKKQIKEKPWKDRPKTEKISKENKERESARSDLEIGDKGYNEEKPWLNRASTRKIAKENKKSMENRQAEGDKPWKNRTPDERLKWFEKDIAHLTKQISDNEKAQSIVKKQLGEITDKKKISERKLIGRKLQEGKEKLTVAKQMSESGLKLLQDAGKDLRKFLASQMGLPDTQIDKIQTMVEKAKIEENKQKESQKKDRDKRIKETRKRLAERREEKKKNKLADIELSDKIKDMKPKEVDKYVDNLFKSSIKGNQKIKKIQIQKLAFKGMHDNTDGAMSNTNEYVQDSNPPHEGEFANAQIMKMLADIMSRMQALENMSQLQQQQQPPMAQQPMEQAPMENQPQQPIEGGIPQEGEKPMNGEGVPIEEGEGEEGEEEFTEESEEGESENPFAESDEDTETEDEDGSMDESMDEESDEESEFQEKPEKEEEEETEQKSGSSIDDKLDHLNTKMDELIGTDDDEDVVAKARKEDKDQMQEESDEVKIDEMTSHPHSGDKELSTKTMGVEDHGDGFYLKKGEDYYMKMGDEDHGDGYYLKDSGSYYRKMDKKMSKKADSPCKCGASTKAEKVEDGTKLKTAKVDCECGKHVEESIETEKETKPSMKSEQEYTKKQVDDLLKEERAKIKAELFESLGVKSTTTPITNVDGQSKPAGSKEDEGVTIAEIVKYHSLKSGTPSLGELLSTPESIVNSR